MTSATTRTVTIVTIVTLLLAAVFGRDGKQHGVAYVGRTTTVETVECQAGEQCPARRRETRRVHVGPGGADRLGAAGRPYRVRRGDTLVSVARRFGVSVRQLQALNGIRDKHAIRVGVVLRVPAARR
jgi:nucleoid-associated protein YgaU